MMMNGQGDVRQRFDHRFDHKEGCHLLSLLYAVNVKFIAPLLQLLIEPFEKVSYTKCEQASLRDTCNFCQCWCCAVSKSCMYVCGLAGVGVRVVE